MIFLHKLLMLFNNILCYCKILNKNGYEWLLLDVNLKNMFLEVHKTVKAQQFRKKGLSNLKKNVFVLKYFFD